MGDARPYDLTPGQRFGAYRIKAVLGRGGMGEVYEALHEENGHRVALKLLPKRLAWSATGRRRFLREGVLAASINHPNSLYVYGTEEIDGTAVIAMELARGGTLKDRVAAEGPMPIAEAVDAALQIIEGLRAAGEHGILHRDIKPANCFLDRDGGIKIGDFGLAISSSSHEETQLTASGAFIGTAVFASPEQVRGTDLDVRSDIYSVGATLYYILTGTAPFQGTGTALLATILERTPDPPGSVRPGIPADLSRIVLKCLAKNPSERFQSYAELSRSLEPFGARAPVPASLSARFTAGVVDTVLLELLVILPWVLMPGDQVGGEASTTVTYTVFAFTAVVYGGLTEGMWGATPGKAILRLRVLSHSGARLGIPRGLLRGVLYRSPALAASAAGLLLIHGFGLTAAGDVLTSIDDLLIFAVFLTARRSNGFRGIHDIFSSSRVVVRSQESGRRSQTLPSLPSTDLTGHVGPYRVGAESAVTRVGHVVVGHDPSLRRKVWILNQPAGAPPLGDDRRVASRPGRLRWLSGRRTSGESWDAFEAVDGGPLAEAATEPRTWSVVRVWLLDLAEEAVHLSREEIESGILSPDRVWITATNRAVLLDFPAPLETLAVSRESAAGEPGVGPFLATVARMSIAGRTARGSGGHHGGGSVLPLHAARLLERWAQEPSPPPDQVLASLRANSSLPATIGRRRRIGQLALSATPILLVTAVTFASQITSSLYERSNPDVAQVRWASEYLGRLEHHRPLTEAEEAEWRSLAILLAGPLRHVSESDSITLWNQRSALVPQEGDRERLAAILLEHPAPSDDQVQAARESLAELASRSAGPAPPAVPTIQTIWAGAIRQAAGTMSGAFIFFAPLFVLLGGLFRGGVTYLLLGMAVVRSDGREASRFRCFLRSFITWSPALLLYIFLFANVPAGAARGAGGFVFELVTREPAIVIPAVVLFVAGVIWTVARPTRGLADRLAKTALVPR